MCEIDRELPRFRTAWRRYGLAAAAWLLAAIFLCGVQWRVVTYVCGNDPTLYIRTARMLLHPSLYGAEALRESLTAFAPGYSIILAFAMKLFGPLAPYWVNFGLLLAVLPVMWFVFRRLMGSDRAAAFSLLGLLLIAFRSHELNAPYLLYPFRESARVVFIYLAYAGLLVGVRRDTARWAWMVGASVAMLAACAIREPSALVLPGLLMGMAGLSLSWRVRLKAWGWFLLPWVIVGAVAACALAHVALVDISQFSVVKYLRDHGVAMARGREMLGWFPSRVGWLAVVMMALGVARALWSSRVLLAWFLLPGILLFIFCAYMQMHVRYFLSSLLFLAVFAGYGLDGLCVALERIGRGDRLRQRIGIALTWGCMVLLAVGSYQTTFRMEVWGPELRAADVRAWQELVSRLEPSADGRVRIAVEQRCRYLEDMLLAYTDADLLDPKQLKDWPPQWAPAHYFEPLNSLALYAAPQWLMWKKIYAHRILADRMDLLLVGSGPPIMYTIAGGEYAAHVLRPWTAGSHQQHVTLEPGRDQVLWLDWGACPSGAVRSVLIQNAETGAPWFSRVMTGNGLQAIFLSGQTVNTEQGLLTVVSSNPVPSRPLFQVVGASHPQHFDFGTDRRVSLNRLLLGFDDGCLEEYPFSLGTGDWRAFRAPILYDDAGGSWRIRFSGGVDMRHPLYLRCRRQDGEEIVRDVTAADGTCSVEMGSGESVDLSLSSSQHPAPGWWNVSRISVDYRPAHQRGK